MKNITWLLSLALLSLTAPAGSTVRSYATLITVAPDGSGDFTSIQKAIESCKSFPDKFITIFVKNGVYHEKVRIPSWNTKITLRGENKDATIITYGDYFKRIGKGPNSTFYTATLLIQGNDFHAENLTVKNSAGPVGQAIAVAVEADRCSFVNCNILGNQDTLFCSGERARQYFKDCRIEGTTDFIFGEATALFEKCTLLCKANSFLTAASTVQGASFGFVFKDCTIKNAPGVRKVLLGRPWRKYAKTVFIRCTMGGFIAPVGWGNWNDPDNEKTVYYAEYLSSGAGARQASRASWSRQLTAKQADRYSTDQIFSGLRHWDPTAVANHVR